MPIPDSQTFVVTSHNLARHSAGDIVTVDDLAGCNIPALVEGGHITPQPVAPAPPSDEDDE